MSTIKNEEQQKRVENVLNQIRELDIKDQLYLVSTIVYETGTLCHELLQDRIMELRILNAPFHSEFEKKQKLVYWMNNVNNSLKNFEKWVEIAQNTI